MSYLDSQKNRFSSVIATMAAAKNSSVRLKPGCVQCGSLLEIFDRKKANFSGKCFNCENWVSDDDDVFDDLED